MKNRYFTLFLSIALLVSACNDWLTVEPETSITGEKLFTTNEGVQQSLNGLYLNMRGLYYPEGYFGASRCLESMACTWTWAEGTPAWYWANHYYTSQSDNSDIQMMFEGLYNIIANVNPLIEGTAKHKDKLKEEVYNIGRGEGFAIRALAHLDLIRLFGPVPTAVDPAEKYLPYVKVNDKNPYEYVTYEEYMECLLADLDSAEMLLAKSDPVVAGTFEETETTTVDWPFRKSRVNYYGVLGLQARARLWKGDTEDALRYARLVKDAENADGTPKVRLMNPTDTSLYNNSTVDLTCYCEHLIGTKCDHYDYTRGNSWRPNSVQILNTSSDFFDLLFSGNVEDKRYQWFWAYYYNRFGSSGYYTAKYLNFTSSSTSQKNFPILRLAEIYLMIAEIAPLDEANEAYEEYCAARNVTFVPLTEENRKDKILLDYICEFAGEGQNFYTYKRLNVKNMLFGERELTEEQYRLVIPDAELLTE